MEDTLWKMQKDATWYYMDLLFYMPDRITRDSHNMLKLLLDTLEGSAYHNDYYVMPNILGVEYDTENPRVEIILRPQTKEDREKVSQVIYTRLDKKMALGMDVTAYYGSHLSLKETITTKELNAVNPYNTRNLSFIGLPVGPICNPSLESINAALNPSDTNFEYFYADINTGKVYFAEDIKGFYEIQKKLGEN